MQSTTDLAATVLRPDEIAQTPWQCVPGCPGVQEKELWRSGDAVDALIQYEPESFTPGHHHRAGHHHIWVISGSATIGDRSVVAGSYVYVPPAVDHPIHDIGAEGCTILQMHRPSS